MRTEIATVTATYSRRMRVELGNGHSIDARIKGKKLKPVCGDRVDVSPIENESDWLISAIHTRHNQLARPNRSGKSDVLAANIDLLVVIAAAEPRPDWYIVDRYLCAAELMRANAVVVYNKTDLNAVDESLRQILNDYRRIAYTTICCSAESGEGVDELASVFVDKTSIIVGQSGVGKSSLINRIAGHQLQKTASISDKSREGRHTTVNSSMLKLPAGGRVIDSPGVRDFAPALDHVDDANVGFREIYEASASCRFNNCSHHLEPGCAVKKRVENGSISERRYASYRRLVNLTGQLGKKH